MTFAELILLLAVLALLYFLMKPLQKRLEHKLVKFFRSKNPKADKPIIDITDYSKEKKDRK